MSTRFVLDTAQLGAALAVANIRPGERSGLRNLGSPSQPIPLLQNTSMLSSNGLQLTDLAIEVIRVTANPAQSLRCALNVAGERAWKEVILLRGEKADGPFVAMEITGSTYDLTFLSKKEDAMAFIGGLLGESQFQAPSNPFSITLDIHTYAALLATADTLQATRLRNRLERSSPAKPVLTPALLETQLAAGCSQDDTRWAVTVGKRLSPADLKSSTGRLEEGLRALEVAGIVGPVQRGLGFTTNGLRVVEGLNELRKSAGFTGASAHVSLFCCPQALWLVDWQGATIRLSSVSTSEAVGIVTRLMESAAVPQPTAEHHCPSCLAAVDGRSRFCPLCGAKLNAEPTPPAQPSQPPPVIDSHCPNPQCGRVVPKGKKFCTACGTKI